MTGSLLQMIFGLAVVLAAIALSAWFARRMGVGGSKGTRLMKIVSSLSVGTKERVVVIEIGAQWMVLGVAPGRVSSLATLPRTEVPDISPAAPGFSGGIDFAALLRKALHRE
jgi:flagellar protein FliO/FliZ